MPRTVPMSAPSRRPPHRSTRGARILTAIGALLCVGAVVLAVVTGRQFVSLLPLDVLGSDGGAGSAVVGTVEAPGTAEVRLGAGRYAILLAQNQPGEQAELAELAGDLRVIAPDGTSVAADAGPQVSLNASRGGISARSIGAIVAAEPGVYVLTAPRMADGSTATVMLTPDQDFAPFLTGIFGTVFGVFGVIVLGLVGLGTTVGGIVWWVLAQRPRTANLRAPTPE